MLKKFIALMIVASMLSIGMGAFAAGGTKIVFNGREVGYDVPPQIIGGCPMVPLRAIFEAWGAKVGWDGTIRRVSIIKGDIDIELSQDYRTATYYQGKPIQRNGWGSPEGMDYGRTVFIGLDASPVIVGGRIMAPLQFVAEALGMDVEWDEGDHTVRIAEKAAAGPESAETELPVKDFPGYVVYPKINGLASVYYSGSWIGAVPADKHGVEKTFQPQTGKVSVEFEATVPPAAWGFGLMDASGRKTAVAIRCDDNFYPVEGHTKLFYQMQNEQGITSYEDSVFLKEYTKDRPAKIKLKIVADIQKQKADIYLEDRLILENQDFTEKADDIGMCILSDKNITLKSIRSDDDELETEDISNNTLEYKNDWNFAADRKADVKAFDRQTGKIGIELEYSLPDGGFVLLDEYGQKPAFIIQHEIPHMHYSGSILDFSGGGACSGSFLSDWELPGNDRSQTVRMELVADIATQSVDVYVNGNKVIVNADFPQKMENFGTCVLYGDVKITGIKKIG